jgi:hypothetical protein
VFAEVAMISGHSVGVGNADGNVAGATHSASMLCFRSHLFLRVFSA